MKQVLVSLLLLFVWALVPGQAQAAGIPHFVNYFDSAAHIFGVESALAPAFGAIFVTMVLAVLGFFFKSYVNAAVQNPTPSDKFGPVIFVELVAGFVTNLSKDLIGEKYKTFLPLVGALFFFILFNNLFGLVPGFPPATENMSTNLAMGLIVFLTYNIFGIKAQGIKSYLAHFGGPVWWLFPVMFVIELISHSFRPVSLSLRLMGNIFGDHMLVGVFTGLTYVVVPSLLLFFGTLVAFVQSFIFTLLSAIYISMAISHDH
jgi:F-type H+-transporting ATPase subunit a